MFRSIRFILLTSLFVSASIFSAEQIQSVPLLSQGQKDYLTAPRTERVAKFADPKYRKTMKSFGYFPQVLTLTMPKDTVKVTVNEQPAYTGKIKTNQFGVISVTAPAYVLVTMEPNGKISLGNLKIATTYSCAFGDAKPALYKTEDVAPRLLRIDGVPNVRDLGGRIGLDGKRVKQGLIYRTAGLNDNAKTKPKYMSEKEALKKYKNHAYKAIRVAYLKRITDQAKTTLENGGKDVPLLPYMLSSEWTVFQPRKTLGYQSYVAINNWKEIPAEFNGAKGRKMLSNAYGIINLPDPEENKCAVFAQKFQAASDGFMRIGFGMDWFYIITVNNEVVFDTLKNGNTKDPLQHLYQINIPVKKGNNLITVTLRSGSAGFMMRMLSPVKLAPVKQICEDILKLEDAEYKRLLENGFEGREPGKNRLNDATKTYLTEDLGIRSDIDLRTPQECFGMKGSPAGEKVTWFHYSSGSYGSMKHEAHRRQFAKVFRVFLDEKNYPIVFHCIAGQDRTGAVACILNGLLGVREDDLYLDWEATGFWNGNALFNHQQLFNKLVRVFDDYPGKTLNDRIEAYVLSVGFTKEDIAKFRQMMLE